MSDELEAPENEPEPETEPEAEVEGHGIAEEGFGPDDTVINYGCVFRPN
jgi:hypothetical protein